MDEWEMDSEEEMANLYDSLGQLDVLPTKHVHSIELVSKIFIQLITSELKTKSRQSDFMTEKFKGSGCLVPPALIDQTEGSQPDTRGSLAGQDARAEQCFPPKSDFESLLPE